MPAILLMIALLACGHVESIAAQLDSCFVVDVSGSVCDPAFGLNWDFVRKFMHDVTEGCKIGPNDTKIAAVKFGDAPMKEWNLDAYLKIGELLYAIDHITCPGGELSVGGLAQLIRTSIFQIPDGDRPDKDNIAILMTDGTEIVTVEQAEAASDSLQRDGIKVIVIGLPGCTEEYARRLSSPPKQNGVTYFLVPDYSLLFTFVYKVREIMCGC